MRTHLFLLLSLTSAVVAGESAPVPGFIRSDAEREA